MTSLNSKLTNIYSLDSLLSATTVNSTSMAEKTLSHNYDDYRMVEVVLLSSANIILATSIIPTEIISSSVKDVYVSYTSDSQTVVYARFSTSTPGKVNVWSNNSSEKKIAIYGIIKKIS